VAIVLPRTSFSLIFKEHGQLPQAKKYGAATTSPLLPEQPMPARLVCPFCVLTPVQTSQSTRKSCSRASRRPNGKYVGNGGSRTSRCRHWRGGGGGGGAAQSWDHSSQCNLCTTVRSTLFRCCVCGCERLCAFASCLCVFVCLCVPVCLCVIFETSILNLCLTLCCCRVCRSAGGA
jgi:hypothetical protein